MKKLIAALTLATLALSGAARAETYGAVFFASKHFGNTQLNNFNPGLTIGKRWPIGRKETEVHAETGVFYNSYEEVSPIFMLGVSTAILPIGGGNLRAGASVGTAYYDTLATSLKDTYGIPNVFGFIPVVALTASYRVGGIEYRFTTVPPDTDTTAIVNFSVATRF